MKIKALSPGIPLLILGLGIFLQAAAPAPQLPTLPGSVGRGEQVLREKGCLDCHSLNGAGGKRAPDFSRRSEDADTPVRLALALWNHSPRMWAEYKASGRDLPSLNQNEVADLFSYFFATLYFEPHGNAAQGRSVFIAKRCSTSTARC